jgi:hypothetical protein
MLFFFKLIYVIVIIYVIDRSKINCRIAIASLTSRFDHMKEFDEVLGFLFNSENLKSLDEANLWLRCKIFVDKFSHDNSSDVSMIFFKN